MQIEIDLADLYKAQGETSSGRPGLVKRKVAVKRGGKTFQQYRWVKAGTEEPAEVKPVEELVEKPKKPPAIMGLNKPEKKIEAKEPASEVKVGSIINVGGRILQVKSIDSEKETVTVGSSFVEDETHLFEDLNVKAAKDKPKPEKSDFASGLKAGMTINFKGKDKKIQFYNTDVKTVAFFDDPANYTFADINKYGVMPGEEPKAKAEPKPKKKPAKEKPAIKMTPDNVVSLKALGDMGVEGGINVATTNVVKFKDGSNGIYKTSGAISTQGEMNFKEISKILGWDNAPETVVGDFGKGEGSCQSWVQDIATDDINDVEMTKEHFDDLAKIAVVDMITGNWDRHYNNVKLDKSGKVWAIDNDTWGDETQYDVNNMRKRGYACKLTWWSKIRGDKADSFQPYADKYVKDVVEHKDEITKFIKSINKNESKFKDDFKDGYKGKFGEYKSVKDLTTNMLDNLDRVTGGQSG